MPHPTLKTCSRCQVEKPTIEFAKNSSARSGLYSYCKPCNSAKTKAYFNNLTEEQRDAYNHKGKCRKYGITPEIYDDLLAKQGGGCAICAKHEPCGKRLAIDHCHSTGEVRGLLCTQCNTAIGKFKEDITVIQSAINYLNEH